MNVGKLTDLTSVLVSYVDKEMIQIRYMGEAIVLQNATPPRPLPQKTVENFNFVTANF